MDDNIRKILDDHEKWHRSLLKLSWADKVRMVLAVREDVVKMRAAAEAEKAARDRAARAEAGGSPENL